MLEARGSNSPKCRAYAVMAICLMSTPLKIKIKILKVEYNDINNKNLQLVYAFQ